VENWPVQYRDYEYNLVQTIAPAGWRWRFSFVDHEFSDVHPTRHEAIRGAHRAIDNLISLQPTLHDCARSG
jgi:hypothetical protein